MTADDVLVVTATLGDSCNHMNRSLLEMRRFTRLPFKQLVSDDGTADGRVKAHQREVVECHGAEWTENPGPTFGISYNLNWLFESAERRGYEWVFLIEDSVRPGWGWLETALDALNRVGLKQWGPAGRRVGALGMTSSYEAWHLACAKALPSDLDLGYFFDCNNTPHFQACFDAFWGSPNHPEWNDGSWCWQRMHEGCLKSCTEPASENWPPIIKTSWRDPIRRHDVGGMRWQEIQGAWGYQSSGGWPRTRNCGWSMGPSAWGLHYLPAWRDAGRWRDGCTFYEGHLGVRLAQKQWLAVNCECPPWLHWSGLAFRIQQHQRTPRHHEPTDGPHGILERDFGANGHDHGDLAKLAASFYPAGELDEVNRELAGVSLHFEPEWQRWL